MKTINKLFAALITTATLVACSNDDDIQTDRMDAVQILTTVSNGEALTSGNRASNRTGNTRADAATDPTYTTAAGTLNLYYGSVNATQSSTFTCAAGQWSTAAPLYWQDLVPATDASKYTFFAVAPAPLADAATGSVATDQSAVAAAEIGRAHV